METRKIPVLIVGGGPVGLALAGELGWRGVECELVEQTDGVITTPKMNEVNTRTMEFCRRWGMADKVLNCPFPGDYPLDVAFVTSLFGYEMGRLTRPSRNSQAPEPHSPHRMQVCSQTWFDPMLLAQARSFPTVQVRHRVRLESFTQSADGVDAELVDVATGERERVEVAYLVGCDGGNSLVRRALGIGLDGKGTIGSPAHTFFRAPDLLKECGQRPATFYMPVDREGMWGNMRVLDPVNGVWRLMIDRADVETEAELDREHYLHRALGRPYPVEWINASIWKRRSVVAERYGEGRVFLAGDAVHQVSPTGALGMNSGIGDAVDLGWKLAAVLQGWGADRLLASYDRERRPVGTRNVGMGTEFYLEHESFGWGNDTLEADTETAAQQRRELGEQMVRVLGGEFRTIGLQLGYRYEDSPICVADGTPPTADEAEVYVPNARPGARAPHAWLRDGRSILDLFGRGFVLLRFPGAPDPSALERAAAERRLPLHTVALDEPEAAELYARRLVLVRPDGHVAWRADAMPENPPALIDRIRGAG
jgi:2-polyprenyl-6-methoxyphenol hydroxylase-like FAD-dependent oxidoreductase